MSQEPDSEPLLITIKIERKRQVNWQRYCQTHFLFVFTAVCMHLIRHHHHFQGHGSNKKILAIILLAEDRISNLKIYFSPFLNLIIFGFQA